MKNKLTTLLAALVLVFAMAVPTFAASLPSEGYIETSDTTLSVDIPLVAENAVLDSVKAPALAYDFTVASVQPSASNGGATVGSVNVSPGPSAGLSVADPSWTVSDNLTTLTTNYKAMALTVDLTKFSIPGVYRYSLTDETASSVLSAAGVTAPAGYDPVKFVDVYIERNAQSNALVVKGYSVHDASGTKGTFAPYRFETYNITVDVSASGAMADLTSSIYSVTATQGGTSRAFYAGTTAPVASSASSTTGSYNANLASGGTIYLAGLSSVDTIAYAETITTGEAYTITHSIGNGTPEAGASIAATAAPSILQAHFFNQLDAVSPTGLVMKYGPYVGLVLIALAIIVLKKKAKN